MNTVPKTHSDQYFAADQHAEIEHRRLNRLTQEYDPFSQERLTEALEVIRPQSILDVGCGTGSLLRWLSGRVSEQAVLAGLDLVPRLQSSDRIKIVEGNLLETPFKAQFDLIHCRMVLEHLADPKAGLSALASMLTPGGVLLVGDLNCARVSSSLPDHALTTEFDRGVKTMVSTLEASGLLDPIYGTKLAGDCEAMGLKVLGEARLSREIEGGTDWAQFQRANTEMLDALVTTPNALDGLMTGFSTPGFHYHDQELVYVTARKPDV